MERVVIVVIVRILSKRAILWLGRIIWQKELQKELKGGGA